MPTPLALNIVVNGEPKTVSVPDGAEDLLYVLRNQVDTHGVKFGCGLAQCGACTVLVNGVTTRSCVTPLSKIADGAEIATIEGLAASGDDGLARIQRAFVENQAAQCAYCISGIIMGSYNWLRNRELAGNSAVPTDDEVKDFLSGVGQTPPFVYLCRCGAHMRIVRAIQQASRGGDR